MNRYFSTFVTGAGNIVKEILKKNQNNLTIENTFNNLVIFQTESTNADIINQPYLNNSFLLINKFENQKMQNFDSIVDWTYDRPKFIQELGKFVSKNKFRKYRIYFFEDTSTVSSSKNLSRLKDLIEYYTDLRYSAGFSDFEIWIIKRKEGISLIGIRLTKKQDYQSVLEKGELRLEIAYMLCHLAQISSSDVALDPFCGHGAIPIACSKHFSPKQIIASDKNIQKIKTVIERRNLGNLKVQLKNYDGYFLSEIKDNSIPKIITDPPWGVSDKVDDLSEKYKSMITNFNRVLKKNGIIVLLSSKHKLVQEAVSKNDELEIVRTEKIYVGGQESFIFKIVKK